MDHRRLGSELLRALRGRRSQAALARRLGYSANVAHTWERGTRFPPASMLFQLAALNGLDPQALARFCSPAAFEPPRKATWTIEHTRSLLKALVGDAPLSGLARAIAVDRTTMARWLRGATEPRVPELLALVDAATHRLVEFVACFVDTERITALRQLSRDLAAQRRMAYELPWSHAVLRALELDGYRRLPEHEPGFIARAIGVDLHEEQALLAELSAARLIRKRHGKWQLARVLTVDTRNEPERDRRLKEHWAEVALARLRSAPRPTEAFHSYNLATVSHEDYARIRALHAEYFERIRHIIAESRLAERVVLTRQELIPLDELLRARAG
jgi:transcriptional regulator with XRE-family HTH domain